jgi:hypothetical protein
MHVTLRQAALSAAFITVLAGSSAAQTERVEKAAVPAAPTAIGDVAPGGEGFRLSYDVYKSGFRALSLDFDVTLDAGTYRTDAKLESAGVIGWLFDWRLDAMSAGKLQAAATIVPQHHRFANSWRGKVRSVEIAYQAGVPAAVRAEPPYSHKPDRVVAAELLPGAVDPMSAVTAIVLANATGPLCPPTTAVYDGRRRYDAQLTPLGSKTLKASNFAAYGGPAEGCHMSFERIAGFKPDDERMKNLTIDIWLADVGTGAGRVPVRLELHTPWGTGFAHLARAQRADGTLVFGTAD